MADGKRGHKLDVYYDGQCPMCTSLIGRVRDSREGNRFRLHDMHRDAAMPFQKEAVEREIHLAAADGTVWRGADAILKMAELYPRLSPLVRLARTRLGQMAAPVVYAHVAANRRFLWGEGARLYWLKIAIVAALTIQLAMTAALWTGAHSYPPVPIWSGLPPLPVAVGTAMYIAAFALCPLIAVSARPQRYIAGLLALLAVYCAFDQLHLQPWIFMYVFLLGALAVFSWRPDDIAGRDVAINTARLIVAATYVYSGLQKMNFNFVSYEFPWIVQPITTLLPGTADALHAFGAFAPLLQVSFGLGLIFRRTRTVSLVLAVLMHLFILAMLGPFGWNWNAVVWPWTAAMAAFDIVLFARADTTARDILWPPSETAWRYRVIVLVLFAILPAASFLNAWDSELSSALYSGNLTEGILYVNDRGAAALPLVIARYATRTSANTHVINLQRWAISELGVIPYAEMRTFRALARDICAYMPEPADLVLTVREQRMWNSRPEMSFTCLDV
jgi:predicted DCC family thiol-disulfide oxidoreductase YuxK